MHTALSAHAERVRGLRLPLPVRAIENLRRLPHPTGSTGVYPLVCPRTEKERKREREKEKERGRGSHTNKECKSVCEGEKCDQKTHIHILHTHTHTHTHTHHSHPSQCKHTADIAKKTHTHTRNTTHGRSPTLKSSTCMSCSLILSLSLSRALVSVSL
jgi:hypothetical protein